MDRLVTCTHPKFMKKYQLPSIGLMITLSQMEDSEKLCSKEVVKKNGKGNVEHCAQFNLKLMPDIPILEGVYSHPL